REIQTAERGADAAPQSVDLRHWGAHRAIPVHLGDRSNPRLVAPGLTLSRPASAGPWRSDMLKELGAGFRMMVVMTVLTGLIYPGALTALCQVAFPSQANGSLIVSNGQVIGSRLIGQNFARPEYLHSRPSAAGSA